MTIQDFTTNSYYERLIQFFSQEENIAFLSVFEINKHSSNTLEERLVIINHFINALEKKEVSNFKINPEKVEFFLLNFNLFTHLNPAPEDVSKIVQSYYTKEIIPNRLTHLKPFIKDFTTLKALFVLGENYKIEETSENSEDIVGVVFKSKNALLNNVGIMEDDNRKNGNNGLTEENRRELFTKHVKNSNLTGLSEGNIIEAAHEFIKPFDDQYIVTLLKEIDKFSGASDNSSPVAQKGTARYFDIPISAILLKYQFLKTSDLNEFMLICVEKWPLFYKELDVVSIMSGITPDKKYYRIFVESAKESSIGLMEDIYYEMFRIYQKNLKVVELNEFKQNNQYFRDAIVFNKVNHDMANKKAKRFNFKIKI